MIPPIPAFPGLPADAPCLNQFSGGGSHFKFVTNVVRYCFPGVIMYLSFCDHINLLLIGIL